MFASHVTTSPEILRSLVTIPRHARAQLQSGSKGYRDVPQNNQPDGHPTLVHERMFIIISLNRSKMQTEAVEAKASALNINLLLDRTHSPLAPAMPLGCAVR
jgi:hypothetical protein